MRTIAAILFLVFTSNVFGQQAEPRLEIRHLTGEFYIFTTYNLYKGTRVGANGMYLLTNEGAVLFDSPWDTTQFQPLLDSIQARHDKKVVLCIATHFHEDRTAGLAYFKEQGAKTYTTQRTDELSKKRGMERATYLIDKDTVFKVGQYSFQTYFPGHGHAPDNIVIWFGKERILYAGCLVKSVEDKSLGNLSDASIQDYATTLINVQKKCRKPRFIIPGHNAWTDSNSLRHTLNMARQAKKKTISK
jgi:metallo-beta-lactamase class B